MKIEKFKVIQHIRELIVLIDREMENFPKKEIELKNRIRMNSYDILEFAYEANNTEDVDLKKKLLQKIIAKVKIVDFLLNLSYDKKILTEKKFVRFGEKIDEIAKCTIGWLKGIN